MSATAAIIRTETTLRMRDPAFPLLLAFVLATCALLVPAAGASYAVITIDNMKPIMSADTALVAAGIVFSVLLVPVYALALDIGHARDRRLLLDRLHLTVPADNALQSTARLIASALYVLPTAALALL